MYDKYAPYFVQKLYSYVQLANGMYGHVYVDRKCEQYETVTRIRKASADFKFLMKMNKRIWSY